MTLRLKANIPPALLRKFTTAELGLLADAFEITPLNPNQEIVTKSMTPPDDTRYPWQQTDAAGRFIGPMKRYTASGQWL